MYIIVVRSVGDVRFFQGFLCSCRRRVPREKANVYFAVAASVTLRENVKKKLEKNTIFYEVLLLLLLLYLCKSPHYPWQKIKVPITVIIILHIFIRLYYHSQQPCVCMIIDYVYRQGTINKSIDGISECRPHHFAVVTMHEYNNIYTHIVGNENIYILKCSSKVFRSIQNAFTLEYYLHYIYVLNTTRRMSSRKVYPVYMSYLPT